MWRVQLYVTQPCLHTLMQTRLSANQSARTILVILQIYIYIYMYLLFIQNISPFLNG